MNRVINYEISKENSNIKVYTFLKGREGYSSRLIRLLKAREGGILLNGAAVRTVDMLKEGDILTVNIPEDKSDIEPVEMPLHIIYEDEDVLIINKPPYLAMHPTHNHQGDTLANAVTFHLAKEGKGTAYKAMGRLDKGTGGLVVLALNHLAACRLSGNIQKEYEAIVKGQPQSSGRIDVPIYRPDPMITLRACSYEKGTESAVTNYRVIERGEGQARVIFNLETGRTHQIRVHMAFIGHPLAGDSFYGDYRPEIGHQLLCCKKCSFIHPVTKENMVFEINSGFEV